MPPKYPNVTVKLVGKKDRKAIITAVGLALKEKVDISASTAWTNAAFGVRSYPMVRRLAQEWVKVE